MINMKRVLFLTMVFLVLIPISASAQFIVDTTAKAGVSVTSASNAKPAGDSLKPIDKFSQMTAADLITLEIPPLSVLLENAKHSPVTSSLLLTVEQRRQDLKIQKKEWLSNIRLYTSYQYGTMTVLAFQQAVTAGVYTGNAQSTYSVGASISLPFDMLFSTGNKVKKQEAAVKQAEYDVERWFEELSLQIIEEYTNVLQFHSTLTIQTEEVAMAKTQYGISEANFINGKMDIQTLSRYKTDVATATSRYEMTYNNLLKAILRLELLSQTKIISK